MKLGIVTDCHLAPPDRTPSRFHNVYDYPNARRNFETALVGHVNAGVDAILMLGDLANSGDEVHHNLGIELCDRTGLPIYIVPGNHDCEEGVTALADRIAGFGAQQVAIPTPGGSLHHGIRIAGLPTNGFDTEANWEISVPEIDSWGTEPVLVVTHVPVFSTREIAMDAGFQYAGDPQNTAALGEMLANRTEPTIVVHGHLHLRHTIVSGATLQIGFAAVVEPPHANATLEIDIDNLLVTVSHDSVASYDVEFVPIISPATQRYRFDGATWIDESPR